MSTGENGHTPPTPAPPAPAPAPAKLSKGEKAAIRYRDQRDLLKRERDAAVARANELQAQLSSSPDEIRNTLGTLQAELNAYKHKDAWGHLREEAGIRPGIPTEKLWAILGYKPEGDPNPETIKAAISAAYGESWARDSIFKPVETAQPPAAGGPKTPETPAGGAQPPAQPNAAPTPGTGQQNVPWPPRPGNLPAGPGMLRGSPDQVNGVFTVTRDQMNDPKWVYHNQAKVAEASEKGLLQIMG